MWPTSNSRRQRHDVSKVCVSFVGNRLAIAHGPIWTADPCGKHRSASLTRKCQSQMPQRRNHIHVADQGQVKMLRK